MVKFTEAMKIGIPHIDSQHREMIDFANNAAALCVSESSKEKMQECLDFLGNYVVNHFNDEEKLQIESKYPRYQQHKEIHLEFVGTFKSLCAEFQKNGNSHKFSLDFSNTVTNWIIMHIQKEDITFGEHYKKVKLERLKMHISK